MPRVVRGIHEQLAQAGIRVFYPEQLDITFDFVPRMCEKQMCSLCFFGSGIGKLCHKQAGLWCPVTLVHCGYKHECNPTGCGFAEDLAKGLCKK